MKGITLGLLSEFAKNFLITLYGSQLQFYVTGGRSLSGEQAEQGAPTGAEGDLERMGTLRSRWA